MDIADRAQADIELQIKLSQERRMPEGPSSTGACLNCRSPIAEPGRRWCDPECRDQWEVVHG